MKPHTVRFQKGYFLVELVIVIVIIGICIVPIAIALGEGAYQAQTNEIKSVATSLAEAKMEEIFNKSFLAVGNVSQTSFSAPFSTYSYDVVCNYVASSSLNTPSGSATEYKRVLVRVYHGGSVCVQLVGLRTDYLNVE
ncbi:MAG: hypothetical protein JW844_03740 [Candidatus Omnitrophica bacterium]|nr:hypothetical protein [Candidatus Omnitrophota bacterium]